jgi:hypothetical protein
MLKTLLGNQRCLNCGENILSETVQTLETLEMPETRWLEEQVEATGELLGIDTELLDAFSSLLEQLKLHHEPTYQHTLRVGLLAGCLARELEMGSEEIKLALLGGKGHDAGKVDVPARKLDEACPDYCPDDRENQKVHARRGYEILGSDFRFTAEALIAGLHHNYELPIDGSPEQRSYAIEIEDLGLSSAYLQLIHRVARVVSIADHFDASFRQNGRFPTKDERLRSLRVDVEQHCLGDGAEILNFLARTRQAIAGYQDVGMLVSLNV